MKHKTRGHNKSLLNKNKKKKKQRIKNSFKIIIKQIKINDFNQKEIYKKDLNLSSIIRLNAGYCIIQILFLCNILKQHVANKYTFINKK